MFNKRLFLNIVAININIDRVYIYKHYIVLIDKIVNYNLNSKTHVFNYALEQYNRTIFIKIIDNSFFIFNKVLLIELEFINKYVNNILLKFLTTICYIF